MHVHATFTINLLCISWDSTVQARYRLAAGKPPTHTQKKQKKKTSGIIVSFTCVSRSTVGPVKEEALFVS